MIAPWIADPDYDADVHPLTLIQNAIRGSARDATPSPRARCRTHIQGVE